MSQFQLDKDISILSASASFSRFFYGISVDLFQIGVLLVNKLARVLFLLEELFQKGRFLNNFLICFFRGKIYNLGYPFIQIYWINCGKLKKGFPRNQNKQGGTHMKNEVIEKIAALATAAFGLVAALAWNGAIQAIFKKVFGTAEGIGPMLVYAIVVTIIAVIVTLWIGKASEKAKSKE